MAKLPGGPAGLAVRRVNAETVKAFLRALEDRFNDPSSGPGKAYLRLLVDEIKLDGNKLVFPRKPSARSRRHWLPPEKKAG
jgi:hypothetical protein